VQNLIMNEATAKMHYHLFSNYGPKYVTETPDGGKLTGKNKVLAEEGQVFKHTKTATHSAKITARGALQGLWAQEPVAKVLNEGLTGDAKAEGMLGLVAEPTQKATRIWNVLHTVYNLPTSHIRQLMGAPQMAMNAGAGEATLLIPVNMARGLASAFGDMHPKWKRWEKRGLVQTHLDLVATTKRFRGVKIAGLDMAKDVETWMGWAKKHGIKPMKPWPRSTVWPTTPSRLPWPTCGTSGTWTAA